MPAPILESVGIARVKRLSFRQATGQIVERWAGGARTARIAPDAAMIGHGGGTNRIA